MWGPRTEAPTLDFYLLISVLFDEIVPHRLEHS